MKKFSLGCLLAASLLLTACTNPFKPNPVDLPANNQFRLHNIVWDIDLPDGWNRSSKDLDLEENVPFFASDEFGANIVILPGSGYEENIIDLYAENGAKKFVAFELLSRDKQSLVFNGALLAGEEVTTFDQRLVRWEGEDDLFLIYSCNYPVGSGGAICDQIFKTLKKQIDK